MKAKMAFTSLLCLIVPFLLLSNSYGQTGVVHERSFMHDGTLRSYLLYVPADYDGQEDWPLVINYHGFNINAADQMMISQMNAVADKAHFLVAYPQGLLTFNPLSGTTGPGWNFPAIDAEHDDVDFTSKLIDHVAKDYQLNLARIHATGWSSGGVMGFYIACALSNRIASVSSVSGHMPELMLASCDAGRPYSALLIYGTADPISPFSGTPPILPPVPTTLSFWASNSSCSTDPVVTDLTDITTEDHSTVTLIEYSDCNDDTEVLFYRVNNGGHTWPGGKWLSGEWPDFLGPVNQDINASEVIWEFFAKHPMPTPTVKSFTLVNARNDQDIMELKDGDVLDLSRLPHQLNVRANVKGHPESVQFMLNGDKIQPQNAAPYALFSDRDGDYKPGRFSVGNYILSATPYTGRTATGVPGKTKEIKFEVVRRSTLAEIVRSKEDFSILATALKQVGYLSTVNGEGSFTAFAPTNTAFETLLASLNLKDVRQIPIPVLLEVIRYHLVIGQELKSADLMDGQRIKTREYGDVIISITDGMVKVNDATVVVPDVLASNGVAHVIDQVLLPPTMAAMSVPGMQMEASPNPGASEVSIQVLNHPNQRVEVAIMNQYGWPITRQSFATAD